VSTCRGGKAQVDEVDRSPQISGLHPHRCKQQGEERRISFFQQSEGRPFEPGLCWCTPNPFSAARSAPGMQPEGRICTTLRSILGCAISQHHPPTHQGLKAALQPHAGQSQSQAHGVAHADAHADGLAGSSQAELLLGGGRQHALGLLLGSGWR